MDWLLTLDHDLFLWLNRKLVHPLLDQLMPFLSGNAFFIPALIALAVLLIWKGGLRGVVCVIVIAIVLSIGDGYICKTLKQAINRPRPFLVIPEAHLIVGRGSSGSMPSSHAANWFSAAMVAFIYYRRSLWFTLPCALLVSFSRIYNGVHYPSDVLAGAVLGAGYGSAIAVALDWFWRAVGRRWFPLWWQKLPSLLNPVLQREPDESEQEPEMAPRRGVGGPAPEFTPRHATADQHWLRLGYIIVACLLLARLAYIAGGTIQLSEDEAYQWLWSKHLALSYYSKPPLIAYTQFLGTTLWGDSEFGIRFFSPLISALMSVLLLRFFAREANARAGFFLLLIVTVTPLTALGSLLMTIDPLSVLFWTAAMLAGWRAVQEKGSTTDWLWVGLWMGLGFLSKYTELFQLLCWAVFFVLWPPARRQLRRPGPYLALLVNFLCAVPVLVWNTQHGWITVTHVAQNAGADKPWHPTLRFFFEFLGAEFALLNPVFFVGCVWACIAFWKRGRHNPKLVYFFSMGAPLFLSYLLYSFRSRLLPNWIAPAVLPLFCLMVVYWDTRLRLGSSRVKPWLGAGLVLGAIMVILGHQTDLIPKLTGYRLPVNLDPLHRVRRWSDTAKAVGEARQALLAEGKPVFIICNHYGFTGQISFYLPEARAAVQEQPLVYFITSPYPRNQFYYWPGYTNRHGENAIFVVELDRDAPKPKEPPQILKDQFESVTELGITNILYHRKLLRPLQLFACRGLK